MNSFPHLHSVHGKRLHDLTRTLLVSMASLALLAVGPLGTSTASAAGGAGSSGSAGGADASTGAGGAGGNGLQLSDRLRINNRDEAAFIILMILVTVAVIDNLSRRLRMKTIQQVQAE